MKTAAIKEIGKRAYYAKQKKATNYTNSSTTNNMHITRNQMITKKSQLFHGEIGKLVEKIGVKSV